MTAGTYTLTIEQGADLSESFRWLSGGRAITDAIVTAGSDVIESVQAAFSTSDVGRTLTGNKLREGSKILAVTPTINKCTLSKTAIQDGDNVHLALGNLPVDNTSYTARARVRAYIGVSDPPLIDLTTETGGIVLGGQSGLIQLVMSATATDALTFDDGVWDLELVSHEGIVYRLLQGQVYVKRSVTV